MQSPHQQTSSPDVCLSSTEDEKMTEIGGSDDEGGKKWNLGSAKSLKSTITVNFTAGSSSATAGGEIKKQKLMVKRLGKMEKEKMPSCSVELMSEDIVVDLLALTGKTPSKNPKRKGRNVQEKIDELIPGAELQRITMARYKVSAKKPKLHH